MHQALQLQQSTCFTFSYQHFHVSTLTLGLQCTGASKQCFVPLVQDRMANMQLLHLGMSSICSIAVLNCVHNSTAFAPFHGYIGIAAV